MKTSDICQDTDFIKFIELVLDRTHEKWLVICLQLIHKNKEDNREPLEYSNLPFLTSLCKEQPAGAQLLSEMIIKHFLNSEFELAADRVSLLALAPIKEKE